jgi:hypothetical protein
MLCRLTRVLSPEAERRLARSIKVAPVELERLDKLPNCFPSAVVVVLDRRTLEIDMHRFPPLVTSLMGLAWSLSGKVSRSFLAVVGDACLEDAGDMIDLGPAEDTGSP